ncbi:DUF4424 domain-containing protein [Methylobacterium sp. sgz302541]|uniref:DUF4424 domain-containing protein n=1 Tax=unclassified Methylobacterium TaxID=2615210 RepID=UPI003D344DCC
MSEGRLRGPVRLSRHAGLRSRVGGVALAAALAATPAGANDSTAALTTGGLVLQTSRDIEMRSEDLSISAKRIGVRYRFFNRAEADETVTVAFPMPEIAAREDANIAIPDTESDNVLRFRTLVDGHEVKAEIEQKALLGGADVTARLRAHAIPLLPSSETTQKALDALPKPVREQLLKDGIVRADDYDRGKGMEHHIAAEWSVRTTYHWRQTFPARREIAIEHAYVPSVGGSVQTAIGSATAAETKDYRTRFCTDQAFLAGVAAMTRKNGNVPPPESRISYVLKTGANWAAPIGDFRLTVDKGDPGALVSFCETNVVKTGPTTFEVRKTDFVPSRDLDILIVGLPQ